jgi:hypothetical protein
MSDDHDDKDLPSSSDIMEQKIKNMLFDDAENDDAENDDTVSAVAEEDALEAAMGLARAESENDLLQAAADMFNRLLELDPEWVVKSISAALPVSDAIGKASDEGVIPAKLTASARGAYQTSLLGIVNCLMAWVGIDGYVAANVRVDREKNALSITEFTPVM